jgi:hypothetical protein
LRGAIKASARENQSEHGCAGHIRDSACRPAAMQSDPSCRGLQRDPAIGTEACSPAD